MNLFCFIAKKTIFKHFNNILNLKFQQLASENLCVTSLTVLQFDTKILTYKWTNTWYYVLEGN